MWKKKSEPYYVRMEVLIILDALLTHVKPYSVTETNAYANPQPPPPPPNTHKYT